MKSPLAQDIAWLNARLDEVQPGESRERLERIRAAAEQMVGESGPDPALAQLDQHDIHAALKLLTTRFHLRNKAEQVHIARVNRRRQREATAEHPRPESLAEAIGTLAQNDVALADVLAILEKLDIQPTLTAHPTESRRRSVMQKQQRIADLMAINNASDATPEERARAESGVRQTLSLLLGTDEVRSRRLEVFDEVRNGIHYLAGAIWDAVPVLYRDLADAIEQHYDQRPDIPLLLRYRTWMGGDRDGNPNVTADLTRRAFQEMRQAAIERHREALEQLRQDLSLSEQRLPIDPALLESIERDEQEQPLDPTLVRHLQHEPFRVKVRHMLMRLGQQGYTSRHFEHDLMVLQNALKYGGLDEVATRGRLADLLVRAKTFGFHLAAIDIRQHSQVHEAAVGEMLRIAGVHQGYAALEESDRRAVLREELKVMRPLIARRTALSDQTRELIETLAVVAEAHRADPQSVGSYVVSMAHEVSDVMEVMVLLREVGLWSQQHDRVDCPIDIAPLFETVEDLEHASKVMASLFSEPAYEKHLEARSEFQEIMLGYSDSNKDGGYWAANWRLHTAQNQLAQLCNDVDIAFRYFHGRGGTVARGGGRAHRAILASPRSTRNGRIRFTEQGEVISFRYAMPAIAHRHLEQIVNAMILATSPAQTDEQQDEQLATVMDTLADRSRIAYRDLIDDPSFWPWFVSRSPVEHIGELPIASRPVARSSGEFQFDNLRAIPWVFAWTQMRYNAPGWYGIGTAFHELFDNQAAAMTLCQSAYHSGGYFRAFIDNAQQEMARARLVIARWYAADEGAAFHNRLKDEFEKAERAILAITGQDALLDNNPVIQQSIRERNPDTDMINALQVELLRRWRKRDSAETLDRSLILLSVNALAAAMQSTG